MMSRAHTLLKQRWAWSSFQFIKTQTGGEEIKNGG